MSSTFFGWMLIASSIALSVFLIVPLASRGTQFVPFDLEAWLRAPSLKLDRALRGAAGTLVTTGVAFLLVVGIGAATSHFRSPVVTETADTDDAVLARLDDYARSIGSGEGEPAAAAGKLLPDVNTMIEQLAARLEASPADARGWGMLGWSYSSTGQYEQAAIAYAKAVELDPSSAELKRAYEEVKAKSSAGGNPDAVASSQDRTGAAGDGGSGIDATGAQGMPPHETDAAIRLMVDRLAARLESSPRDVDGWTRLMRSRVVLGEKEVAVAAFRKALDVFKDEAAASATISAAATELGLKTE